MLHKDFNMLHIVSKQNGYKSEHYILFSKIAAISKVGEIMYIDIADGAENGYNFNISENIFNTIVKYWINTKQYNDNYGVKTLILN